MKRRAVKLSDANLPPRMTCADCGYFADFQCGQTGRPQPITSTQCDFAPSRFIQRPRFKASNEVTVESRPLTKAQAETLQLFKAHLGTNGYPPTLREIARSRGCSAITVHEHLTHLKEKGYLQQSGRGRGRSLSLTARSETVAGVSASAQCLTCEEFVIAPHLEIGEWSEGCEQAGRFAERSLTVHCPHCDRTSVMIQRKYL